MTPTDLAVVSYVLITSVYSNKEDHTIIQQPSYQSAIFIDSYNKLFKGNFSSSFFLGLPEAKFLNTYKFQQYQNVFLGAQIALGCVK